MAYLSRAELLLLDQCQQTHKPVGDTVERIVAEHRELARAEVLREVNTWLGPVLEEAEKAVSSP